MADPLTLLKAAGEVQMVFDFIGGLFKKSSADKAAQKAQEIAKKNAELILRDLDLIDKQIDLINANGLLRETRDRYQFANQQGDVVTGYSYGNIDISHGTPMDVMRENARNFELDMLINQRNDNVAVAQLEDERENVTLSAEIAIMGGQAQASSLRAQGNQALVGSVADIAKTGYERGFFSSPTSSSQTAGQSQIKL